MLSPRLASLNYGFIIAFASLLTVGGGGCTGGAPEIAYEDYAAALEGAACEWQTACNLSPSEDSCRETHFFDRKDPYVSAAIEAGTVVFDSVAAYRCVDEVRARSCDRTEPSAPSCAEVFLGQVAPEEPCLIDDECVGDGLCGFDPNCTDQCCAGACRLLPGPVEIGESCVNTVVDCVEGAYCKIDAMTNQRTVCTAELPLGSSCTFGDQCVDAAYCDFSTEQCVTKVGEGELCPFGQGTCQDGLYCDWVGQDYEEQRCILLVPFVALGEPCDTNIGNVACADVGALCSDAGICVLAPAVGEACVDNRCAAYASCADGTCIANADEGKKCGVLDGDYGLYVWCQGELVCDNSDQPSGFCVVPEYSADACEAPGIPIED